MFKSELEQYVGYWCKITLKNNCFYRGTIRKFERKSKFEFVIFDDLFRGGCSFNLRNIISIEKIEKPKINDRTMRYKEGMKNWRFNN